MSSKLRYILITTAATLLMMAVVGIAQYLVSSNGTISPGVMVAVAVPTGFILGQTLAKTRKTDGA